MNVTLPAAVESGPLVFPQWLVDLLAAAYATGTPVMLDGFCGEGGAGEGYHRAGWLVVGLDNSPARLEKYPHPCLLVADAVVWIATYGHLFTAVHASPPCTGYSRGTIALPDRLERYDRLIPATREAIRLTGRPYIIENVEAAHLEYHELIDPLTMCWTEFFRLGSIVDDDGTPLWMRRHRVFETSFFAFRPSGCNHPRRGAVQCAGAYGGARRDKDEAKNIRKGGYVPNAQVMAALLGIDWMTETGLRLSIPPVYTEHLGRTLLDALTVGAEHDNHPTRTTGKALS